MSAKAGKAVDPAAMRVAQTAKLLNVDAGEIARHVEQGAPTVRDGRLHLIEYVAWLVGRLSRAK